ncbi:hypothetical protein QVD17_30726 [Tagetes erecta]|uniref:Uncharacterized protein n=1 Tax=Tagetes erecta TaxID=13708 RepID=A0AAD8NG82_TARER|nr:hypothetical protein QVD17_30726 [Tagetes erecta]
MSLMDEDDDEIFEVDMEIDDVDKDYQHEDHDYSEDEDNIQEPLQVPAKRQAIGSGSKGNRIGRRKRLHITSTISNEGTEDHVEDDHVEDHQVLETQGHQTNEIQGSPKKVRGYTQKKNIWDMIKTERIGVTFNNYGKPIGDEGNELVQFLGTLVRMTEHVSIEYSDWRKVPIKDKETMYKIVKSKFDILPKETKVIKQSILHSMGRKWKAWKGSLKAISYDPSHTVDEIVAQQVNSDKRVNPTQFKKLVTQWFTPEYQKTCDDKRLSRSKMKERHVSGTKSFARLAYEMATENNGVYPTRGEVYIKTRTRKDGTIVDDEAAHVVASLKDITIDSTITTSDLDDYTNDDYSKLR